MTSPKTDAPTGVDDFGSALGSLLRSYLGGARALIEDVPGGPRGFQVLAVAATDSCRNQASIAEHLGLDRTVMTYLVDDLERGGLVERRPDPADRRSRRIVLTDAGRATFDTAQATLGTVERHVLGALSDTEAHQFRSLLLRATSGPGVTASDSLCSGADPSESC